MKRYHPVIAIILGNIIIAILVNFLPNISLSDILGIFILVLGGFVATYVSRTNKSTIGLYTGIVYSIGCLPIIFIFKTQLTFYSILYLALIFPTLGFIGGYIGKISRERLDNEN